MSERTFRLGLDPAAVARARSIRVRLADIPFATTKPLNVLVSVSAADDPRESSAPLTVDQVNVMARSTNPQGDPPMTVDVDVTDALRELVLAGGTELEITLTPRDFAGHEVDDDGVLDPVRLDVTLD